MHAAFVQKGVCLQLSIGWTAGVQHDSDANMTIAVLHADAPSGITGCQRDQEAGGLTSIWPSTFQAASKICFEVFASLKPFLFQHCGLQDPQGAALNKDHLLLKLQCARSWTLGFYGPASCVG